MTIKRLQAHFGFSKMPFGKQVAPASLFRHRAHAEAVARINWLIQERGLGMVTGEVGAGKTVAARAALASSDITLISTQPLHRGQGPVLPGGAGSGRLTAVS